MNNRKFGLSLALVVLTVFAVLTGLTTSTAYAQGPDEAVAACATPHNANWKTDGNCASNPPTHFLGTLDSKPLVFKTDTAERMRIAANGNVGIGTTTPTQKLHVSGVHSRLRLESSSTQAWTVTEYKTNAREWHTGVGGSAVGNDVKSKYYIFDGTASQFRMAIDTSGNVGIGTTAPLAKMEIRGEGPLGFLLMAVSSTGVKGLSVHKDGFVQIGALSTTSTAHACLGPGLVFARCSSAAEYVPSINAGNGYPETADLVSIAPTIENPYGDTHGPFAVQKSTSPCDPNLLGFIVKPESGADGVKLNDHYLPLAIYGYFPAKVTLENGVIRRGDPLTSSSKPGYAMRATEACKIIGYALEDAETDGIIQTFADLGENAAGEVATLRDQLRAKDAELAQLKQQVETLQQQNSALDQRLSRLERFAANGGTESAGESTQIAHTQSAKP